MEEGGIEGVLVVEDAPESVEEFAHDGDDGDFWFLTAGQGGFVAGFDGGAVLDGDQGGQKEGGAKVNVPVLLRRRGWFTEVPLSKGRGSSPAWATHWGALSPLGRTSNFGASLTERASTVVTVDLGELLAALLEK